MAESEEAKPVTRIDYTELDEEALIEAENRIAESMGPEERNFRDRYAHLVNAHREQARHSVELEKELRACKESNARQDVVIAQARADLASAKEDTARLHASLTNYYDELFLEHLKIRQVLGAVLATLPNREASIVEGDTRWTAIVWPSPVPGIVTYRAVRGEREPVEPVEEDEDD